MPAAEGTVSPEDERADLWARAGVRVCATLLLRGRRVGEAIALLKAVATTARTMHSFLAMFEVSSRLPPPPPLPTPPSSPPLHSSATPPAPSAPPLRFSQAHMLEVLEAALTAPQHGLASEGNLLRWQLRSSLRFGHAPPPPPPPLACPPPTAATLLSAPRIVIVMPFVAAERARLTANLGSWRDGGGIEPCASSDPSAAGGRPAAREIDLMLYAADGADRPELSSWLPSAAAATALLGSAARCFRDVHLRHANLSASEQHYLGGWDNTGPNNLFFRLFFDQALHRRYDAMLWMEADVLPVKPLWLERLTEEAAFPRGYWRKGPAQQPRLAHSMVSAHHYHMNSAGLYRLGQPCFVALLRRVALEHPGAPHDVSTHLFLHEPRHFHIWQQVAHRFHYTDFVQNRLDVWSDDAVAAVSADTFLVHGKHRADAGERPPRA